MRPAFASVLGIAVMLGVSALGQLATASFLVAPDGAPLPIGRTFLSATLALTFGAAVVGAALGTATSRGSKGRVALAIAICGALFGVLSATSAPPETPALVAWAMPVLAFAGAMAGGAVRGLNRPARSAV